MEPNMKKKRKQLSEFLASRGFRDEDGAAERLGKSVRTLALWRQKRTGPKWTLNGEQVIYHDDWLLDYLNANMKEPVRSAANKRAGERSARSPRTEAAA
jgi:hypothetical protein